MRSKLGSIIPILCLALIMMLPTENSFAQRRGEHHYSGVRAHNNHMRSPHFGSVRRSMPRGARVIRFNGNVYNFHKGVYYRPHGRKYIIARPPIGLRLGFLPPYYFSLNIGMHPYFYYYGTFYAPVSGDTKQYEVVEPPIGALVDQLPNDCEEVVINGTTYYKVDNTYYKVVLDQDNSEKYEVVGKTVK